MTNLLQLDRSLISSVISAFKLNRRSTTAWTNKLYCLKQNLQVYGNIIQKSLKNLENLVSAGSSGIMHDFFIYEGKPTTNNENDNTDLEHLQKSAQNVAKLCQNLPNHKNHKLFSDNWFSTLELMIYLKNKRILAVGTIRLNRLGGCCVSSNKDLQKNGRGSSDYHTDNNSGIIVVKWADNNVVQLVSNFGWIEPMTSIERKEKERYSQSTNSKTV